MPTITLLKDPVDAKLAQGFKDSHPKIARSYAQGLALLGTAATAPLLPAVTPTSPVPASTYTTAPSTPVAVSRAAPTTPSAPTKKNPHALGITSSPRTPTTSGAAPLTSAATVSDPDERIADRAALEKYKKGDFNNKQGLILYVLNALRTEPLGTSAASVKNLIELIEDIDNDHDIFGTMDELLITLSAIQQAILEDELLSAQLFMPLPIPVRSQQTIKTYNLESLLFDLYLIAIAKKADLINNITGTDARRNDLLKRLAEYDFDTSLLKTSDDKRTLYKLLIKPDITTLHTPTPKSKHSSFWGTPPSRTRTGAGTGNARRNLFAGAPATVTTAPAPTAMPVLAAAPTLNNPKLTPYLHADFLDNTQRYTISLMIIALSEENDAGKKGKIEDATVTLLEEYKIAKAAYQDPAQGYAWEARFVPHVANYQKELSTELSSGQKVAVAACCVAGALLGGAVFFAVGLAVTAALMGADGGFSAMWGAITGASLGMKAGLLLFAAASCISGSASAGYLAPSHLRGAPKEAAQELAKSLAPRPLPRLTSAVSVS